MTITLVLRSNRKSNVSKSKVDRFHTWRISCRAIFGCRILWKAIHTYFCDVKFQAVGRFGRLLFFHVPSVFSHFIRESKRKNLICGSKWSRDVIRYVSRKIMTKKEQRPNGSYILYHIFIKRGVSENPPRTKYYNIWKNEWCVS